MDDKTQKATFQKGRILVVEDDRFYQELCREVLEEDGYEVDFSFTGEEAVAKIAAEPFHIVITDLVLPGIDGFKVLTAVKQISPSTDVILMTGYATVESAVKALKRGASDYLTKPINPEELKLAIKRCLELRSLFDENNELKVLVKLYHAVQLVSNTLELEQLYPLSLDSILQGVSAQAGIALFRHAEDKDFSLVAFRGIDQDNAHTISFLVEKKLGRSIAGDMQVIENPTLKFGSNMDIGNNALVIPLNCEAPRGHSFLCNGIIMVWKDEHFHKKELANIRFIIEQIRRSFENALDFRGAQEMVFVDDLTGLFNMRYLNIGLENEIKRAKRFKKGLALLFIDLDHFKEVNDTHGHLVGSKLLKEAANILKKCIREVDIAIRYGGDEFIVILTDTDPKGAMKVAERIRKKMEEKIFLAREGIRLKMTCCVGVACYPEDAENKVDLIHLADKAMYRGKETTRNVVYRAAEI